MLDRGNAQVPSVIAQFDWQGEPVTLIGTHPTWSTRVDWLGLPIDHVLHSPELVVVDRRVGPNIGSDHRAVVVEFVKRRASP